VGDDLHAVETAWQAALPGPDLGARMQKLRRLL
jgi:hypothetical protein